MRRTVLTGALLVITLAIPACVTVVAVLAQDPGAPPPPPLDEPVPPDEYFRGTVVAVLGSEEREIAGYRQLLQQVRVRLLTGEERGREIRAVYSGVGNAAQARPLRAGERVVVAKSVAAGDVSYAVVDRFRLPALGAILAVFFTLVVIFSRVRGVTSILGLAVSILVIAKFVVPQILAGRNPLLISFSGAIVIALLSIYLAHGFSRRTTIAVVSTMIALVASAVLSIVFVSVARLFGGGTEEAFYLQIDPTRNLNLQGLLLGGILLGALGVLDDITTSQAAAVDEIRKANPYLPFVELYRRGLSVGREHITALVNTLVLAYAGASLPLFLLFSLNLEQPLWLIINTEFVAEEVVRSIVGSVALILAVPITTLLAARGMTGPGD